MRLPQLEQLGGLNILVNNAGVVHMAEIGQFPAEQFERMLSVNVRAVFHAGASLKIDGGFAA